MTFPAVPTETGRAEDVNYAAAQADPVAAVVLAALHDQDARTYNGMSGDIGELALIVAKDLRDQIGREERNRLADVLDEGSKLLIDSSRDKNALMGLVLLLLRLDKS